MASLILSIWPALFVGGLLAAVSTAPRAPVPTRTKVGALFVAFLGAALGAPFMIAMVYGLVLGEYVTAPADAIIGMTMFLSLPYGPLGFLQSLRMAPWGSFGAGFELFRIAMAVCWGIASAAIILTCVYI